MKKIVLLDACYFQAAFNGNRDITKDFSEEEWERVITDTVAEDFFFKCIGEWWRDREALTDFLIQKKIYLLDTEGRILFDEGLLSPQKVSLRITDQEQIRSFLKGDLKDQGEKEELLKGLVKTRKEEQENWFKGIPQAEEKEEERNLDSGKIRQEVEKIIKNPLTFEERILKIFNIISKNYKVVENMNPWLFSVNSLISKFKECKNPESELPTFCNLIWFQIFSECLIKRVSFPTKTVKNQNKKGFRMKLAHPILVKVENYNPPDNFITLHYLQIKKNFLNDLRIVVPYLHYINAFATFDKSLAATIHSLFPQHADKVQYYHCPNK